MINKSVTYLTDTLNTDLKDVLKDMLSILPNSKLRRHNRNTTKIRVAPKSNYSTIQITSSGV